MKTLFEKLNSSQREIKVSYEEINGGLLINIVGSLDTFNSDIFKDETIKIINEAEYKKIVFNFDKLNYVSSTGIGAFTYILEESKKANKQIYLLNISEKIEEIFSLLGFLDLFNIIKDVKEILIKEETNFPVILSCPSCKSKLKVVKAGKFKCGACSTILEIDNNGKIKI